MTPEKLGRVLSKLFGELKIDSIEDFKEAGTWRQFYKENSPFDEVCRHFLPFWPRDDTLEKQQRHCFDIFRRYFNRVKVAFEEVNAEVERVDMRFTASDDQNILEADFICKKR